jgi:hypothetical protein
VVKTLLTVIVELIDFLVLLVCVSFQVRFSKARRWLGKWETKTALFKVNLLLESTPKRVYSSSEEMFQAQLVL